MFKKNTAVVGFAIGHFINTSTGAAVTTGTPTCKRLLDGNGGACANAAAYNTDGAQWEIDLEAADLNGDMVGLSFTLTDCQPLSYRFRTATGIPDGSGHMPCDVIEFGGTAVTGRDIGASVLLAADQPVDVTKIGGSAQSLTDLKDLVDTGYDPATHKVAGVVITDTCTTNTDMRGTNSAALASVCTETRLAELDAANLPTDVANVKTQTAAIEVDTQDLQTQIGTDGAGLTAIGDTRLANLAAEPVGSATQYDGIPFSSIMELLLAFIAGKTVVTDNGTTRTFTMYKRNGTTAKLSLTAAEADGARSSGGTIDPA